MKDLFGQPVTPVAAHALTLPRLRMRLFAELADGKTHSLAKLCKAHPQVSRGTIINTIQSLAKDGGHQVVILRRDDPVGATVRLAVNAKYAAHTHQEKA